MPRELKIFLTAVMFYTRIPCPKSIDHSQEYLDASARYFPVMGWIVGGAAALVFYLCQFILPIPVSIVLSMIGSIMITGAFHEDGFADTCDGFGGGWTKEQVLDIMKDSRIGTYGAIGLIFILLFKFILLAEVPVTVVPVVLIAGHSLSRFAATLFRYVYRYVRENEDSKAKPMAKGPMSFVDLWIAGFFGVLPFVLFRNAMCLLLIIPVITVGMLFARYSYKRIGGYTGDCLGAAQQISEITFYLSFVLLWRFI